MAFWKALRFDRRAIAADFALRGDWADALVRGGFDFSIPTVWLLEGLLYYQERRLRNLNLLDEDGNSTFDDTAEYFPNI